VNPTDRLLRNNGFTFGTATASGVTVPYELGYGTTFDNDRLPRHYQIGGWFDDSSYADPFTDVNGRPQVLTGAASATDHGRAGLFARFDQMIWRPDNAKQRGLTLFGVAMTNTEGHVTEKQYYELGLLQTGTFPGRDLDTLGFLINDQEFSNLALERIELASGRTNIPRREVMMELAYGVQVNNAIRISPNLQYIINPDQQAEPSRPENIPDAFVIGVKFTVDFLSL
jgi:porin